MSTAGKTVFLLIVLSLLLQLGPAHAQSEASPCPAIENKKALKLYEEGTDRKNSKEKRLEALREAIDHEPEFAMAHYKLGEELLKTARINGASLKPAQRHFEQAVKACPEIHFDPYYYLGAIALGAGEFKKAVTYYDKYYELSAASDEQLNDKREEEIKLDYKYAKFFADAYDNPVPFSPAKVSAVSTETDEFLPLITPDNTAMLLTRRYKTESQVKASIISSPDDYIEKFVEAKRSPDGFEEGLPLPSPFNENSNFHYGGAAISIDNKHLFLTICKPASMGYTNCDIYSSQLKYGYNERSGREEYYWTELENLGPNINTPDGFESQPSISADGNTLYFTSARADSRGLDIYFSKKKADGSWDVAKNIGDPINTAGNDKTPFMHSDSRTLYFASDGHLGFGGLDVFLVKQDENGQWSEPKNIGHPINTPQDEQAFAVSTDGKRVYYSAKEPGSLTGIDIFSFELYKAARPDKVVFVKGQLKDESGEPLRNATVELKSMDTKNISRIEVDPGDGKYAAVVAVKEGEDVVLNVKAEGKAFQSKLIETDKPDLTATKKNRTGEEEELESTFSEIDLEVAEVKKGGVYRINDIYYSSNSAEISDKSKLILDEFAIYLNENPSMRIAIHGHTDNVGNDAKNLALSADRAFSVKQYLESKGVAGNRIEYKGFGETVPFTTNETPEGRALNRRTEFLVLGE